jgi:hypothetical protein
LSIQHLIRKLNINFYTHTQNGTCNNERKALLKVTKSSKISLKTIVFWDAAPRTLAYRRDDHPDDDGRKYLRNVGQLQPEYTVQHPEDNHRNCHRRDNLKSQDALPDGIAGSWHHTRLVIGSQYERIGASRVGPSEAKCSLHCFNDTKLVLFYGGALVHIISKRSVRCANT